MFMHLITLTEGMKNHSLVFQVFITEEIENLDHKSLTVLFMSGFFKLSIFKPLFDVYGSNVE